jgi:hypothetical protein
MHQPDLQDLLLSAGEIDCREGFTNQISKGMYADVESAVVATVRAYVGGVRRVLRKLVVKTNFARLLFLFICNDTNNLLQYLLLLVIFDEN